MKTLAIALLMLVGCATQPEWKCPKAPKVVAEFAVGQEVAFVSGVDVLHIDKGALAEVIDIGYKGEYVYYHVHLDKSVMPASNGVIFKELTIIDGPGLAPTLEAVVYPDPALAPAKGKQKE